MKLSMLHPGVLLAGAGMSLLSFLLTGQDPREAEAEEETFPDLTPFTACRMWPTFRVGAELEEGEPWESDSIEKCQHLATVMIQAFNKGREAAERTSGSSSAPSKDAAFGPTPPIEIRRRFPSGTTAASSRPVLRFRRPSRHRSPVRPATARRARSARRLARAQPDKARVV